MNFIFHSEFVEVEELKNNQNAEPSTSHQQEVLQKQHDEPQNNTSDDIRE